jgi:hypothetical protein
MKKWVRFLGSLEVTVFLMVLVSIWFALAALLSVSSQYGNTMRLLNDQLVASSLFRLPHQSSPLWSPNFDLVEIRRDIGSGLPSPDWVVRHWLWGAFVLAFLTGVNLIFGSREWFFDLLRRRLDLRRFLLLAMHALFGIVLVGHLLSAAAGFKEVGRLPVRQGERIPFLDRYSLRVDRVEIEQEEARTEGGPGKRAWVTPDRFLKQPLWVTFTLFEGGEPIHTDKVSNFHPVVYEGLRVTLLPFSFRSQVSHDFVGWGLGPQISVSRNPGVPLMIVAQPLWILVLAVYTLTTLRSKRGREHADHPRS